MSCYHDSDDLKRLGELKALAPAEFKGFVALDAIVGREDLDPEVAHLVSGTLAPDRALGWLLRVARVVCRVVVRVPHLDPRPPG